MPKPLGLRNVCPRCASTAVIADLTGDGGTCLDCKSKISEFKKLHWTQITDFKKDIEMKKRYKHFSLKSCDETQAILLIIALSALLVVFILLGS